MYNVSLTIVLSAAFSGIALSGIGMLVLFEMGYVV